MPLHAPASTRPRASGITDDPNSTTDGRIIPASRRADGSLRKERRVKPGFTPQEDVQLYRPRRIQEREAANEAAKTVPGAAARTTVPGAAGLRAGGPGPSTSRLTSTAAKSSSSSSSSSRYATPPPSSSSTPPSSLPPSSSWTDGDADDSETWPSLASNGRGKGKPANARAAHTPTRASASSSSSADSAPAWRRGAARDVNGAAGGANTASKANALRATDKKDDFGGKTTPISSSEDVPDDWESQEDAGKKETPAQKAPKDKHDNDDADESSRASGLEDALAALSVGDKKQDAKQSG